jgi:hypothetical protein
MEPKDILAETLVDTGEIYHYVPADMSMFLGVQAHESAHLVDNDLTDFQRLTILMDVFRNVPELDFRGYADYVRSRFPAVVTFLDADWVPFTEAGALLAQLREPLIHPRLREAVSEIVKTREKKTFELLEQLGLIIRNVTSRFVPGHMSQGSRALWEINFELTKEEDRYRRVYGFKDKFDPTRHTLFRLIRLFVMKTFLQKLDFGFYPISPPPLLKCLDYLSKLSAHEIPRWSSFEEVEENLFERIRQKFDLAKHDNFLDALMLLKMFPELARTASDSQSLENHAFTLCRFVLALFPNVSPGSFPTIIYRAKSAMDRSSRVIDVCNQCSSLSDPDALATVGKYNRRKDNGLVTVDFLWKENRAALSNWSKDLRQSLSLEARALDQILEIRKRVFESQPEPCIGLAYCRKKEQLARELAALFKRGPFSTIDLFETPDK